jgi:putative spermidine/putrescine transport system permease protein
VRAGLGLRLAAAAVVFFLYLPIAIIVVNAFNVESSYFTFPPPGFTTDWFGVAFRDPALWSALRLSVLVASVVTAISLVIGTLLAAAVYRRRFFGRDAVTFLVVLPIALPGIVTGIALRSSFALADIPFGTFTLIVAHGTFCIVIVYNNAVARFRRMSPNLIEASADLGASGLQTVRHVVMPQLATALLAGGVLAFALSFDEIIVTTFTAGQQQTVPIYILRILFRPRARPVTNVVAILVILVTFLPIMVAQILSRRTEAERPAGAP